jgi:hypothetical protein
VLLLLGGMGLNADALNLPANGSFDQNVSGWDNPTPPPATWSPVDANGAATSGSAQLLNDDSAANSRRAVLRQCIAAEAGSYRLEVAALVPAQSVSGRVVVNGAVYPRTECAGGITSSGGYFIQTGASWQRTQREIVVSNTAGGSRIEITVSIEKDPAGGSFFANVDDIGLFGVPLFADGFE